jgi:hypothetical protein
LGKKLKKDGCQLFVHDADERSIKSVQIIKEEPVPETPLSEASPVATESQPRISIPKKMPAPCSLRVGD